MQHAVITAHKQHRGARRLGRQKSRVTAAARGQGAIAQVDAIFDQHRVGVDEITQHALAFAKRLAVALLAAVTTQKIHKGTGVSCTHAAQRSLIRRTHVSPVEQCRRGRCGVGAPGVNVATGEGR